MYPFQGRQEGRQDSREDRWPDTRQQARWKPHAAQFSPEPFAPAQLQPSSPAAPAHSLAGLVHDARNMVMAMDLYCCLLEEPGVLAAPFHHYAEELRLVSGASRRLLEKLASVEWTAHPNAASQRQALSAGMDSGAHPLPEAPLQAIDRLTGVPAYAPGTLARGASRLRGFHLGKPVEDLAEELLANRNLLAALAGPGIRVNLSVSGGHRPIAVSGDDLTRILVNLVRNAAEAMSGKGDLRIALEEGPGYLSLTFADSGPGIPPEALETIFSPGYSTRIAPGPGLEDDAQAGSCAWPVQHRGLGLSIVRSLVTAAGGSVWAANRRKELDAASENAASSGAIFTIEFPLSLSPAAT